MTEAVVRYIDGSIIVYEAKIDVRERRWRGRRGLLGLPMNSDRIEIPVEVKVKREGGLPLEIDKLTVAHRPLAEGGAVEISGHLTGSTGEISLGQVNPGEARVFSNSNDEKLVIVHYDRAIPLKQHE